MRQCLLLCLFLTFLLLSGCATQQPNATLLSADEALQASDPIALFVGTNSEGMSTVIQEQGEAITVVVGKAYTSALNMPCRKAELRSVRGIGYTAVCEQAGQWLRAPLIFSAEGGR